VTLSYGRLRALRRPNGALTLTTSGQLVRHRDEAARAARAADRRRSGARGAAPPDVLDAAVNRPRPGATAFVHRRQRLHCAYLSFWGASDPPATAAACAQWVRGFHAAMRPYASGFAYQNDIDPELGDWERAYYGANLARLQAIKRRADPAGRFAFAQGGSG